ncbi:MAG: hypothetical protein KBF32_09695, partial [Chitinophagales bacterium]|nr:hypothetical protein [Chitinophagales bacterium]
TFSYSDNKHVCRMVMHPYDPAIMFAATTDGVYKTTDGWVTKSLVKSNPNIGSPSGTFRGIDFKPGILQGNPQTLYASSNEVWKSTDDGSTWTPVTGTGTGLDWTGSDFTGKLFRTINVIATNSDMAYARISVGDRDVWPNYQNNKASFLYQYDSSTGSWTNLNLPLNSNVGSESFFHAFIVRPNTTDIFAGTVSISRKLSTETTFADWSDYQPPGDVHADIHDLAIQPQTDELFACTDGGLFKYTGDLGAASYDLWIVIKL